MTAELSTVVSSSSSSSSWLRNIQDKKLNIDLMTLFDLYTVLKDPLDHMLKDVELPELKELLETIIPILQCTHADISEKIVKSPVSNDSDSSLEKNKKSLDHVLRSDPDVSSSTSSPSNGEDRRQRKKKKKSKKPTVNRTHLMPTASDILLQSITTCALDVFAGSTFFSE